MAVKLIELLEVVEVEVREREGSRRSPRPDARLLQAIQEVPAVRQTRQLVRAREQGFAGQELGQESHGQEDEKTVERVPEQETEAWRP